MTTAVSLGVVGAGYWGPNLIRNAMSHPSLNLRWVCDLDGDRASKAAYPWAGVRATSDISELLSDPTLEAIAIATPAPTHSELATAAIQAGKHLLIEKPLAHSLPDGVEIVRAAEEAGLTLMCDHTFCHTEAVRSLRNLVRSGKIGDVRYIDSVRINLGLVQSDTDVFWDLAPHDLSILDFILPPEIEPVAVSAQGSDPIGVGQACVGHVSLTLSNNALAHLHLNWLSPTKVRTTIVGGSEKMVVWDDLNPAQKLSIYDTGVEVGGLEGEERELALVSYRIGDMLAPVVDGPEALYSVMGEFSESIRMNRPPSTDGWSGVRVLSQLAAIHESYLHGGTPVELQSWSDA